MEELQSTHSFLINEYYRYYTVIMYYWYLQYGSNALSDAVMENIAEQWSEYFKNAPIEGKDHDGRKHSKDTS